MRAVLAEAAAKGLTVLPDGSGVARVQSPPPGALLHQGERIRVQFAQMNLGEILSGVGCNSRSRRSLPQSEIDGLEYDSRRVSTGFPLFRFPGSSADGRQFAQDALARGAVAVASESAAPRRISPAPLDPGGARPPGAGAGRAQFLRQAGRAAAA